MGSLYSALNRSFSEPYPLRTAVTPPMARLPLQSNKQIIKLV